MNFVVKCQRLILSAIEGAKKKLGQIKIEKLRMPNLFMDSSLVGQSKMPKQKLKRLKGRKPKRLKLSKWVLVVLFALSMFLSINLGIVYHNANNTVYLALVGSMSGENQLSGQQMAQGARLYVKDINRQGGVNGKKVKLIVFDDRAQPEEAEKIAKEIVGKKRAIAVLGNDLSATVAGKIYQEAGITTVSGMPIERGAIGENPWYFQVMPNSHFEGIFIANYVRQVMKETKASIISDNSNYSKHISKGFENTFKGLRGKIEKTWKIGATSESIIDSSIEVIVDQLLKARSAGQEPGRIFLATDADKAEKIIVLMKRKGLQYQVIGGSSIGDNTFRERFKKYYEEQAQPGYFLDGIYAASHIIYEVAGQKGQLFRDKFVGEYGNEPSALAAGYYDAAKVAVEGIEKAEIKGEGEQLAEEREKLKDALAKINKIEDAIEGVGGNIYFDYQGNAIKPVAIGIFENEKFIPAPIQLQPVTDVKRIEDLEKELDEGRILLVNSKYMHKTRVVYTGIDINEVSNLDFVKSSYKLDFYLWFRYQGNFKEAENIEFINGSEELELGEPIQETKEDGMTYRAYRVKEEFLGDFYFHDYPFDSQKLGVKFRHKDLTRENLIYVRDALGMRLTTNEDMLARFDKSNVFSSITDWEVKEVNFFQDIKQNDSTLGNPQLFSSDSDIEYSQFNAVIDIKRNFFSFILKNTVPLALFFSIGFVMLFLPITRFDIGQLMALIIPTIFVQMNLDNALPDGIGYTTVLDYAFYLLYGLVFLEILVFVICHKKGILDSEVAKKRIYDLFRIFYPSVIFLLALIFAVKYEYIILPNFQQEYAAIATSESDSFTAASNPNEINSQATTLTIGSWRTDDREAMEFILALFKGKYPHINVNFIPTIYSQYNSIITSQLKAGIAPDLFHLPAYSLGQQLFKDGYLEPLGELSEIKEKYPPQALSAWATEEGEVFGLPLLAVSHGIYYNQEIFDSLYLEVPKTWEDLLYTAQILKDYGYIPFANGSGGRAEAAELIFMNLAPNFIGGQEGRLKYLSGDRCFNDKHTVAAFEAVADLKPYLPEGQEKMTFYDSRQLFLNGKAAMWLGGSWEIGALEKVSSLKWGIFATPAPAGQRQYVTFHPDIGMVVNAASPHKEEARAFVKWLMTPEGTNLLSSSLPGFFPMSKEVPEVSNKYAKAFLELNNGRGTDVRWAYPKLMDGLPDGYSLMYEGTIGVLKGTMTPRQAADNLQYGLSQWFEPAQICSDK